MVGLPPRRTVRIGVRLSTGVAVGTDEQQIALASDGGNSQAIAVSDECARALALQSRAPFGMAFKGKTLFAAVGGRQGRPGIQGIPGPAGGSAFQRTAGHDISALRIVYELDGQVHYLDYRDSDHIDLLLGLTLGAASAGSPINVQSSGLVDDSSWSWAPGRIWLGADGALTQTPPVAGYDVLIGAAVASNRLLLNLQDPLELE